MPIYEFRCVKCSRIFEKLFMTGSKLQVDIICPHCGSDTAERVMSSSNYNIGAGAGASRASITTKSCSPGNSCTSFEIPGPER